MLRSLIIVWSAKQCNVPSLQEALLCPCNWFDRCKVSVCNTEVHTLLSKWNNHFWQILNIQGVSHGRQKEIHTAELTVVVHQLSNFCLRILHKSWKHKSPSTGQIQAELTQAVGKNIHLRSVKLLNLLWMWNNCQYNTADKKKGSSNYRRISILIIKPTRCTNFSNLFLE